MSHDNNPQSPSMVDTILLKVFIPVLTAAICGLGAWVWSTAATVARMETELVYTKKAQDELSSQQRHIGETLTDLQERTAKMELDMQYIKAGIDELKKGMHSHEIISK